MTRTPAPPLSRPFLVAGLSPDGAEVAIEATPAEREAVAGDLGLPALHAFRARLLVKGDERRAVVTGRVTASLARTCVVTLDDFDTDLDEAVEVQFAADPAGVAATAGPDRDPPDLIVDGRIDLGALAVEFLALGLDPYPRKPSASFAEPPPEAGRTSPFAGLARLKGLDPQGS